MEGGIKMAVIKVCILIDNVLTYQFLTAGDWASPEETLPAAKELIEDEMDKENP